MTPEACAREDLRIALGALALDALDADEARDVRRHLAGCPDCQAEYASFVGVRTVLDAALASAPAAAPTATPAPAADGRSSTRMPAGRRGLWRRPGSAADRPARRRPAFVFQLGAVAASLILAVTAFFVGAATSGTQTAKPPTVTTTAVGDRHDLPPVTNAQGVTAAVSYRPAAWGTWVGIKMNNVPVGYTCKLTAYGKDGTVAPVSSWNAVAGQSSVTVNGSISMSSSAIDHFEVEVDAQGYDITIPMVS